MRPRMKRMSWYSSDSSMMHNRYMVKNVPRVNVSGLLAKKNKRKKNGSRNLA